MNQKEMRSLCTPSRSREDREKLEKRRLEAARLFEQGYTPADVRRKVGGTSAAVSQWHTTWTRGGLDALRSAGASGPTPKLTDEDKQVLKDDLLAGARTHGFPTDTWRLSRIREHIRRRFGVTLGTTRIFHILTNELGFSCQKPERRSRERDNDRIAVWKRTTWPALKKSPQ